VTHKKDPDVERTGMWATISSAVMSGWPATFRLVFVLAVAVVGWRLLW